MEYLQINQNKLKITLTKSECESYGIKEEGGDFNSVTVRDTLGKVLKAAGAELFVTRLSSVGERERRAVTASRELTTYKSSRARFIFNTINDLTSAVRALRGTPSADLYRTYDGDYLLDIKDEWTDGLSSSDILLEFSTRLPSTFTPSAEWDTLLIKDNAIETLRQNANKY